MANESSRSPEIGSPVSVNDHRKPEAELTASGRGRLPEAVALVEKPETETSDGGGGDQSSSERKRRRRRRRKYGRLKRVRLEALGFAVTDGATTESESEKQFIVVDGPQVGILRSPTASTTASDGKGTSWFRRMWINRNRKSTSSAAARRKRRTLKSRAARMSSRQRCEQYLKQFTAALFSTLGLLCLMVAYTILGGYVFSELESSNEVNVKADVRQVVQMFLQRFTDFVLYYVYISIEKLFHPISCP